MESYGGYGGYGAEPVPDMVKQFVVYFYRHIRSDYSPAYCRAYTISLLSAVRNHI